MGQPFWHTTEKQMYALQGTVFQSLNREGR